MLLLGAPFNNDGSGNYGGAFVNYGSSSGLSDRPSWTAGLTMLILVGYSGCICRRCEQRGYSDVIVGAPFYSNGSGNLWVEAFVYYGSSS